MQKKTTKKNYFYHKFNSVWKFFDPKEKKKAIKDKSSSNASWETN